MLYPANFETGEASQTAIEAGARAQLLVFIAIHRWVSNWVE